MTMKHCFMCKGELEEKLTTYMVDLESCIIIVKNVPSLVCKQCGETSYTDEVAQELERIVVSMRNSLTEIAVVNFNKAA